MGTRLAMILLGNTSIDIESKLHSSVSEYMDRILQEYFQRFCGGEKMCCEWTQNRSQGPKTMCSTAYKYKFKNSTRGVQPGGPHRRI